MDLFVPVLLKRKHISVRVLAFLLALLGLVGALSQTAQAENTYVITDGNEVMIHTTFSSDPAKVLQEAGVNLDSEDIYTTVPGEDMSEITVQRLQEITVNYQGELISTTSYGESMEEVLVRLGISADENIRISHPLNEQTYDGMEVHVDQVLEQTETYTVEIPFETVYCDDPSLPAGEEKILVAGEPGQLLCRASVTYVNAQEQNRVVYEQTEIQPAVQQIVAVGTGEGIGRVADAPVIGDGVIVLPSGEVLNYTHTDQFVATAYTKTDDGCDGITANGTRVKEGVVAVDPEVIPYGTRMFIVTNDGTYIYGLATAEDCGGAIQKKRLDLYMDSTQECIQFGVRNCTVYFLGDANWMDN